MYFLFSCYLLTHYFLIHNFISYSPSFCSNLFLDRGKTSNVLTENVLIARELSLNFTATEFICEMEWNYRRF